jgi:hypothetical protein
MSGLKISSFLTALVACAPAMAAANYPVYQGYQPVSQGAAYNAQPMPAAYNPQMISGYNQPVVTGYPQQTVGNVAAQPTRVTGQLPRVGSNVTSAGRQYYQSQDFDRLADSGLYVGLSVGYATSVQGGITADYVRETNAWFVPGSFQKTNYKTDTVLPLQISVGAALNNDFRVDFSYARYSGIAQNDHVQTSNGAGGFVDAVSTGGDMTSSATMLNLYYNLDLFTGYIAGGMLRPYVGVGLGISTNTLSDYVVYDKNYYPEFPDGTPSPSGIITGISNIYAYHAGGTREQLAYMAELGVTTEMSGGLKLDFFVRYAGLGKVQSSGSIVLSQTVWIGTGSGTLGDPTGAEVPAENNSVSHYTNWRESGSLATVDAGVRLRLQF